MISVGWILYLTKSVPGVLQYSFFWVEGPKDTVVDIYMTRSRLNTHEAITHAAVQMSPSLLSSRFS